MTARINLFTNEDAIDRPHHPSIHSDANNDEVGWCGWRHGTEWSESAELMSASARGSFAPSFLSDCFNLKELIAAFLRLLSIENDTLLRLWRHSAIAAANIPEGSRNRKAAH